MRFADPNNAVQLCVRRCPNEDITTWQQARDFAIYNNSRICRYDIDPEDYDKQDWTSAVGPCPQLPVYKRYDFCEMVLLHVIFMYTCSDYCS